MSPESRRRLRPLCIAAGLAGFALLWWQSATPGDVLPIPNIIGIDKLLHLTAFALLAAAWCCGLGASRRAALLAFALVLGYGAIDEWHQSFTPGRDSSGWDLLADGFGASLGAFAATRGSRSLHPRAGG